MWPVVTGVKFSTDSERWAWRTGANTWERSSISTSTCPVMAVSARICLAAWLADWQLVTRNVRVVQCEGIPTISVTSMLTAGSGGPWRGHNTWCQTFMNIDETAAVTLCAFYQLLLPYTLAMPPFTATLEPTCWLYDGNARSGHREEGVTLGQR